MNSNYLLTLLMAGVLVLTGCSSSSSSDSDDDPVKTVPDTTPPSFTSSNTASVTENRTDAITLVATDDSGSITYSISAGIDAASFDINGTTGVITFITAPDFETQQNYSFTAKVTDDSDNNTTQSISITIIDEEILHNTTSYESVVSPYTQKVWLDRNLGADQVCIAFNDSSCYGDYYQWGRNYDGHQDSNSDTNSTLATDIINTGTSSFIICDSSPFDWVESTNSSGNNVDDNGSLRAVQWSKIDGTSVCPEGFRVPTISELTAETIDLTGDDEVKTRDDAYNSFLKLPTAGYRFQHTANMQDVDSHGHVWSSSPDGDYAWYLHFDVASAYSDSQWRYRAYGSSVRCLKE